MIDAAPAARHCENEGLQMFCNFCGKKISPEKRVCPYCGQPQGARRGGNGFWDIFTEREESAEWKKEIVQQPVPSLKCADQFAAEDGRKRRRIRIRILRIIILVLLLVSIVSEIFMFAELRAMKKNEQQLNQRIDMLELANNNNKQIIPKPSASEKPQLQPEKSQPETNPDQPAQTATATENAKPRILTQPSNPAKMGAEAEFEIAYEGESAVWKYLIGENNWVEITEPDERFEILSEPGCSRLKVTTVGDESVFTKYICTVTGTDGSTLNSEAVRLIKSPTETEKQDTQPVRKG